MAAYSVELRRTASTTASLGSITADATRPRRGKLYEVIIGSEATPADNAFLLRVRRCTAAGTSTAVTPNPNDPADAATETDAGENHTVEPTYTANSEQLVVPFNQKATFRWYVSKEDGIIWPATASNGVGFETPTASAVTIAATARFQEQ
jgi:hypothetical protein